MTEPCGDTKMFVGLEKAGMWVKTPSIQGTELCRSGFRGNHSFPKDIAKYFPESFSHPFNVT
jgi:hypothetical protein